MNHAIPNKLHAINSTLFNLNQESFIHSRKNKIRQLMRSQRQVIRSSTPISRFNSCHSEEGSGDDQDQKISKAIHHEEPSNSSQIKTDRINERKETHIPSKKSNLAETSPRQLSHPKDALKVRDHVKTGRGLKSIPKANSDSCNKVLHGKSPCKKSLNDLADQNDSWLRLKEDRDELEQNWDSDQENDSSDEDQDSILSSKTKTRSNEPDYLEELRDDELIAAAAQFEGPSDDDNVLMDDYLLGKETLTVSDAFERMEMKSQLLDESSHRLRKEMQQDVLEQRQRDLVDTLESHQEIFDFPTDEILHKEQELGVDLSVIKTRIQDTLSYLSLLKKHLKHNYTRPRSDYCRLLRHDLSYYYGYNLFLMNSLVNLFPPAELAEYLEANECKRPLTIRTNSLKTRRQDLIQALSSHAVKLEPIKWSKLGIQILESSAPIGALPQYLAGHYMIQSASSMTSVIALDPKSGERILDMCAAPGGKTSYIAQLMKNTGLLIANDSNKERLPSLSANLHRMGVKNSIITNFDGSEFPKVMGGFDRVLVDAPCTGTGVVSRDPTVKSTKEEKDLGNLTTIQKTLLLAAIDSVDCKSPTGGIIVYSTCSVLIEENEAIVNYALRKRHIKILPTGLEFGKPGITSRKGLHYSDALEKSRRFYPHVYNMDGFFVCKIKKLSNSVRVSGKLVDLNIKKEKEQESKETKKRDRHDMKKSKQSARKQPIIDDFEPISSDESDVDAHNLSCDQDKDKYSTPSKLESNNGELEQHLPRQQDGQKKLRKVKQSDN